MSTPAETSPPQKENATQGDRRLRMIVYASLFAFSILAGYGFYLISSLTRDMHLMAQQMAAMSPNVQRNMDNISANMHDMTVSVHNMTGDMHNMTTTMHNMNGNIDRMSRATSYMAWATAQMQADIWSMNQNISTPLSLFNSMLPFGANQGRYPAPAMPLGPPTGVGRYPGGAFAPPDHGYSPQNRRHN